MPSARILLFTACALLGLAAFYAVYETLLVRYEDRGTYPEYSSYRKDPIGTRVFHGALQRLPGLRVERSRAPLEIFDAPAGSTVLFLGSAISPDPVRIIEKIEAFADAGGRVVIAHRPEAWMDRAQAAGDPDRKRQREEEEDIPEFARMVYLDERWGFDYETGEHDEEKHEATLLGAGEKAAGNLKLPGTLPWRSALYFDKPAETWQVLYSCNEHPVLMQRAWGKGSIVLASDSYFLSNEAMRDARHPELLAWMVGSSPVVVFDEAHLGLASSPGIIDLIYRFHLEGVLLVFVLCCLLGAWIGLASPAPRREATASELQPRHQGRESLSGLVSLLRRSVPPAELMQRCAAEWQRSAHFLSPRHRAHAEAIRRAAAHPLGEKELLESYRHISRKVQERS